MLLYRPTNINKVQTEIANPLKNGDAKPWIYIPNQRDMTARLPKLIPLHGCPDVPGSSTGHVLFSQDSRIFVIFSRIGTILLRKNSKGVN
jgi:hypothetical protein